MQVFGNESQVINTTFNPPQQKVTEELMPEDEGMQENETKIC